jgi:hypothetical protein
MTFAQEPKAIQKALLVASKFGFLRKETFWNYLTTPNVSYKYDLWNHLMASGYLAEYNRIGVSKNYYGLSIKGTRLLGDLGYQPVAKAHPLHFEHDEIILNFTLACEKDGLIKDSWQTERVVKQLSAVEQVKLTGAVLEKIPDLIFQPNIEKRRYLFALEVERTRKSKSKYDAFVLAYSRHKNIGLVLVAYKDEYIKRSILESMRRLGYRQGLQPIGFCKISDMISQPSNFEMTVNSEKITFNEYVENLKAIVAKRPEKSPEIHSGKNSGDFSEAA